MTPNAGIRLENSYTTTSDQANITMALKGVNSQKFRISGPTDNELWVIDGLGRLRIHSDTNYGLTTGWVSLSGFVGTLPVFNLSGSLVGYIPVYSTRA